MSTVAPTTGQPTLQPEQPPISPAQRPISPEQPSAAPDGSPAALAASEVGEQAAWAVVAASNRRVTVEMSSPVSLASSAMFAPWRCPQVPGFIV